MSIWNRITTLLATAGSAASRFPPTIVYNENWMLRLVVDSLVEQGGSQSLKCVPGASWYSEALLPSAFLSRTRGDSLGESHTHADAVVGHFEIGNNGKADLELASGAKQLTVIEGKIFSGLSKGVQNAGFFDQAARNVACMAQVLCLADVPPAALSQLSFHVVAPASQIESGIFGNMVTKESIRTKVERRVEQYGGERVAWFEDWFVPTVEGVQVSLTSWEDLLDEIAASDGSIGQELGAFYADCLRFGA